MLYGWVGSVVFVLIILVTLFRCGHRAIRFRKSKGFLAVLVVGLTMFWGVFLGDEYKISILRNPGYHMMFWIWLGLSNAAVRTLRYGSDDRIASKSHAFREGGR